MPPWSISWQAVELQAQREREDFEVRRARLDRAFAERLAADLAEINEAASSWASSAWWERVRSERG